MYNSFNKNRYISLQFSAKVVIIFKLKKINMFFFHNTGFLHINIQITLTLIEIENE